MHVFLSQNIKKKFDRSIASAKETNRKIDQFSFFNLKISADQVSEVEQSPIKNGLL